MGGQRRLAEVTYRVPARRRRMESWMLETEEDGSESESESGERCGDGNGDAAAATSDDAKRESWKKAAEVTSQ